MSTRVIIDAISGEVTTEEFDNSTRSIAVILTWAEKVRNLYDSLLVSAVFQTIRAQASQDLAINVNYTDFVAAVGDAKMGRENKAALEAAIGLLVGSVTLTQAEYDELVALRDAAGLTVDLAIPAI